MRSASKKKEKREANDEKQKLQAAKFLNFFQKLEKPEHPRTLPAMMNTRFKPFEIKEGMTLAPIHVRTLFTEHEHDTFLKGNSEQIQSDYLAVAKLKKPTFKKHGYSAEVKLISENFGKYGKWKLFQFHDNIRPPYYGTWHRKSREVSRRRPFSKSDKSINYEYDSDQDWEDEPSDAEECKSDEEEDKDDENEESDDGFFVQHGYLSSNEGSDDDAADADVDGFEKQKNQSVEHDEQRKQRLAQRAKEWDESQKQKAKRFRKSQIVPIFFGPSWERDEQRENVPSTRFCSIAFAYNTLDTALLTKTPVTPTKQ